MRIRAMIGAGALTGCLLVLSGCSEPLFPKDTPRSPYDRYLTLRGRSVPKTVPNAYGIEQPNLRERLKPLAQR